MNILHVVGARPNFMKAAPVLRALARAPQTIPIRQKLVHTGQHYDAGMSGVFFEQLGMGRPDVDLGVGSGTHASQTSRILAALEPVVAAEAPDLVVVYGDVNSTLAAALLCSKLSVPVAHVEAGLRSGDRTMPEEINRLLTDQVADLLLAPSQDACDHLVREGIDASKIHLVGNVMIDTLTRLLPLAESAAVGGIPREFALATLHRPALVDDPRRLDQVVAALAELARDCPVVFPVHPRTKKRLEDAGPAPKGILFLDPLPYLEFLHLQKKARVVVTDSGGVQEETTYLGVPCLTLRPNTERPVTVDLGTNIVIGYDLKRLKAEFLKIMNGERKKPRPIPYWDGRAAERIRDVLVAWWNRKPN